MEMVGAAASHNYYKDLHFNLSTTGLPKTQEFEILLKVLNAVHGKDQIGLKNILVNLMSG